MRTLITNIKSLVQVEEKTKIAVCGQDMSSINCIDNAYLIIENDKIVDFGQMNQLQKIALSYLHSAILTHT